MYTFDVKAYIGNDGTLAKWAWPGGYPIYYLDNSYGVICPACANKEKSSLRGAEINWEAPLLYCEDCNTRIESAYAEDADADEVDY